ncbi:MAG: polymorphic toxin type 10 domain-containing protein [Bryobacteraceae bacterium]
MANPVPGTFARVVPGTVEKITTLGRPGAADVFVTAASDIRGLNATGISQRLTIPSSNSFTVLEFPSRGISGVASPVNRLDLGFVGGGRTAGGAREFVIPNGPLPPGIKIRIVR